MDLWVARTQPFVIVIEDLHWIDPSTLELLHLLADQCPNTRVLLLCTARPEFCPPWPLRAHHTLLTLDRLNARDTAEMMANVTASQTLSHRTIAALVQRSGGVPLFIEELTRTALENGQAELIGHTIPVSLHDSLMARIDRLGPARAVLQIGGGARN